MANKINEKMVLSKLLPFIKHNQQKVALNNFTPMGWWECDLAIVTKSGYFKEYEIKCSRADFLSDHKKVDSFYNSIGGSLQFISKHDLLSIGSSRGPSEFYYVLVDGIFNITEIPKWSGLVVYNGGLTIVKKAPRLHNHKFSDGETLRMLRNGTLRHLNKFIFEKQ